MPEFDTATTLRERVDVNAYWFWFLHGADRRFVVAGLAALVFLAFVTWGIMKPVSLQTTMETSDMVETVFAGLVGAIITSTTLVVSINQLVLSQEIGSLGTLRNRMNLAMDYRRSTDNLLGRTSPSDPARYLAALVETTEIRAVDLRDALADGDASGISVNVDERRGDADDLEGDVDDLKGDADHFERDVDAFFEDLLSKTAHAREALDGAEFGTFDVVAAALDFEYTRLLHNTRWLARKAGDSVGDGDRAAFDELVEVLAMFAPLREYVKGLYIQWTLVQLSRAILYSAVVAFTVAGGMVVFVDASTFSGTLLGVDVVLWVVSGAFTVSTLPFLVFVAYVLRLATLAKQTLTIEPLLLE
ncbi:S46 family peptidase [Halorubellus sp. JP-L1]|uniref:S46 family peptidase n=1 Tax=Halorubellus sp. JP-L1 TaxID=2715753 RepID=UPI0014093AC4|nr:S46 family peptidase [Halorubellus sp. JP-L1]NHN42729.1 S46 family peptidase [Halorubellus sp. JP-L1]